MTCIFCMKEILLLSPSKVKFPTIFPIAFPRFPHTPVGKPRMPSFP